MKFRDLIDLLNDAGWVCERTRGSHMIFRHPRKRGQVVVPAGGKLRIDVRPGTLNSILKQAGIKS